MIFGDTENKNDNRIEYRFVPADLYNQDVKAARAKGISVTLYPVPKEVEPERFLETVKGDGMKQKGTVRLFKREPPYYAFKSEGYTFHRTFSLIHFDGKDYVCQISTTLTTVDGQVTVLEEDEFIQFASGLEQSL